MATRRERDGEGPSTSTSTGQLIRRRYIVTGAARGIGREIAGTFPAQGATVALLDLDDLASRGRRRTRRRRRQSPTPRHRGPRRGDRQRSASSAASTCWSTTPASCASRRCSTSPSTSGTSIFDVNVRSMLVTTQVAARAMIAAPHGRARGVAARSSTWRAWAASVGAPNQAHYAASKAAVDLAHAGGRDGARPATASPSTASARATCSPTWAPPPAPPEMVAAWSAKSPLGRLRRAADVAAMALFLASERRRLLHRPGDERHRRDDHALRMSRDDHRPTPPTPDAIDPPTGADRPAPRAEFRRGRR